MTPKINPSVRFHVSTHVPIHFDVRGDIDYSSEFVGMISLELKIANELGFIFPFNRARFLKNNDLSRGKYFIV